MIFEARPLRGTNLSGADLHSADLRGCNMAGANIRGKYAGIGPGAGRSYGYKDG